MHQNERMKRDKEIQWDQQIGREEKTMHRKGMVKRQKGGKTQKQYKQQKRMRKEIQIQKVAMPMTIEARCEEESLVCSKVLNKLLFSMFCVLVGNQLWDLSNLLALSSERPFSECAIIQNY